MIAVPEASGTIGSQPVSRRTVKGTERLLLCTLQDADRDRLEATAINAAMAAGVQGIVKISGGAPSLGPAWQLAAQGSVTLKDAVRLNAGYVNVAPRPAARAGRRRNASPFEVDRGVRIASCFVSGADGAPTDAVWQITSHRPRTLDRFLQATAKGH